MQSHYFQVGIKNSFAVRSSNSKLWTMTSSCSGFGGTQLVQFATLPGPPGQFPSVGENLHVDHQCPKCGYVGSGDWTPKAPKEKKPRQAKKKQ